MTKKKILVSACLVGQKCRYDGGHCSRDHILDLSQHFDIISVCPEEMGGLPTPRESSEIQKDNRILTKSGKDVSEEYNRGAALAAQIAQENNIEEAYLKSNSPMCGCDIIYDGTFSGTKIGGDGILTRLLKKMKIKVHSVD
ncbi:MAG: DUF523 domain-containing protein [Bdellovibrio sp.]